MTTLRDHAPTGAHRSGEIAEAIWLSGAGETGALLSRLDWRTTPLGPIAAWPQSLRTSLSICLMSRFPMAVCWGPEYAILYNDAYSQILGTKHPSALGRPCFEVWSELAHIVRPMFEGVTQTGVATWSDDLMLPMLRHGYLEEAYFTLSYSAVRGESGLPEGVFVTVTETTERYLAERRLNLVRELGDSAGSVRSLEQATRLVERVMAQYSADIPFSLLYLVEPGAREAKLAAMTGLTRDHRAAPLRVPLVKGIQPWPLDRALECERPVVIDIAADMAELPGGIWPDPARRAILAPLCCPGASEPLAILVTGVNPRRALDEPHREFFSAVARQISNVMSNGVAHEETRRRAELLAELDQAKTAFFSNVSHEFRTPLTLMLGPLEDLLAGTQGPLSPEQKEQVQILQRSSVRLLKLVNTLLDFARIEAGRVRASFAPVDLAELTRELASMFRATVERAGLELHVDCAPLPEPVHVDRDLWEKIVLNLLSNAFKFTFHGSIAVSLRHRNGEVELEVRDTGVGIPAHELRNIFKRFHRVPAMQSRSHEGSGIGLSLVQELAHLHGGDVSVDSELGHGTAFRVTIRSGTTHLPGDAVTNQDLPQTPVDAAAFVNEALHWIPADRLSKEPAKATSAKTNAARILVADDNADMRAYLQRLLAMWWSVECVCDGHAALESARRDPPDLILTDVMMPGMDGFGLLRALKTEKQTQSIPVIMLSARAGEEACVEGLDAGADDYLIKPFSARELIARVRSQLAVVAAHRSVEEAWRRSDEACRAKDEFLAMLGHELRNPLAPISTALHLMKLRGGDHLMKERTIIERQVNHVVRLVDDLLDVARIARGKVQIRSRLLDVAEVIAKAIEMASPLLEERRHRLVSELAPGLVVKGDELRLTQVIGNLLTNAAKYTDPGGFIQIKGRVERGDVVVQVIDNGIGISADLLPHVFDLFVQGTRPQGGRAGLGLGLSLVRSLVELHGGSVAARSGGTGQGSQFMVRLPFVKNAELSASSVRSPDLRKSSESRAQRILIVDDNRDAAEILADALTEFGYDVRAVFDGPAALEAAEAVMPHVALIDIGMPVMDGYELGRRFRELPGGHGLRLVAITGYGQEKDRRKTSEVGFDLHLVKPVDFQAITQKLESWLATPSRLAHSPRDA